MVHTDEDLSEGTINRTETYLIGDLTRLKAR